MSEWQSIETFVGGMEYVILWDGNRVFPGWLSDDGWLDCDREEYDMHPTNPQPTHWMPLPPPPKKTP